MLHFFMICQSTGIYTCGSAPKSTLARSDRDDSSLSAICSYDRFYGSTVEIPFSGPAVPGGIQRHFARIGGRYPHPGSWNFEGCIRFLRDHTAASLSDNLNRMWATKVIGMRCFSKQGSGDLLLRVTGLRKKPPCCNFTKSCKNQNAESASRQPPSYRHKMPGQGARSAADTFREIPRKVERQHIREALRCTRESKLPTATLISWMLKTYVELPAMLLRPQSCGKVLVWCC